MSMQKINCYVMPLVRALALILVSPGFDFDGQRLIVFPGDEIGRKHPARSPDSSGRCERLLFSATKHIGRNHFLLRFFLET